VIFPPNRVRIMAATRPIDFRKGHDSLKAMLIAAEARDLRKDERTARLEKLVAALRQAAFGRRPEQSDPDQFELALEDPETAMALIHAEEDGACLKLCACDLAHAVFG